MGKAVYTDNLGVLQHASIFDKFREFIPWVSLDGFATEGDAGESVEIYGIMLTMITGATTDNDVFLQTNQALTPFVDAGQEIALTKLMEEKPMLRGKLAKFAGKGIDIKVTPTGKE